MMRRYHFLRHTADAKFRAYGSTLEEAFENAALATAALMWEWQKVEPVLEFNVEVQGQDLKQLLVNFLEEIVFLLETRMFLLHSVVNIKIDKEKNRYRLCSLFRGDSFSDKYVIFGDVKAITYNEMEIHSDGRFILQVVVDM